MTALSHPSPNFGPRRGCDRPWLIVLHYTAMADAASSLARLCDPSAEVSAHYLVDRDGTVESLVAEDMRAWHAGAGSWQGCSDVNSASIGIELQNDGAEPYPDPQMAALEDLLAAIMARWDIPPEGVIGHSDLAPGRKSDPGPRFNWDRLAERGLAARPGGGALPADLGPAAFRAIAQAAGYTAEAEDAALLAAVRLRYRAGASGPLQPADFAPLVRDSARA